MKTFVQISLMSLCFMMTACGPKAVENAVDPSASTQDSEAQAQNASTMTAVDKTLTDKGEFGSVTVHYPSFGRAQLDSAIEKVAQNALEKARTDLQQKVDEDKAGGMANDMAEYYHETKYEVTLASADAVDIAFLHEGYMGGAHGYMRYQTVMLDGNGNAIDPWSLFANESEALNRMSEESRKQLVAQITDSENVEDMVKGGTEPTRENFRNIVRTEKGFRVYFDPYSVAPGSEGGMFVDFIDLK